MSPGLADRLGSETRALHTAAERSTFMQALLRGRLTRSAYRALLCNLYALYASLEPALERHAADPMIAPVYEPALWRTASLAHDLHALNALSLADQPQPSPVALRYVLRLRHLEATEPGLLLAHAYVRYLGDLSGGQVLRRIVTDSAAIGAPGAVAFYDFGDMTRVRALAHAFRHGLASLKLPGPKADALVAEAALGFRLHRLLFDELAISCGLAPTPASNQPG